MSLAAQIIAYHMHCDVASGLSPSIADDHVKRTVRGPPCWLLHRRWIEIAITERTSLRLFFLYPNTCHELSFQTASFLKPNKLADPACTIVNNCGCDGFATLQNVN
jgi:hypothetical protein